METPYQQYVNDLANVVSVDFSARLLVTPKASYTFPAYANTQERLDALYDQQNDALTKFAFLMDQLVFSKDTAVSSAAPAKLQALATRLKTLQTTIASVENARLELNRVGEFTKAPEKKVVVAEMMDRTFRAPKNSANNQDYMQSVNEFHAWCIDTFSHKSYYPSHLEKPPVRGPPKIPKNSSHKGGGDRYTSIKSRVLSLYRK
jgi:hypothetical protein